MNSTFLCLFFLIALTFAAPLGDAHPIKYMVLLVIDVIWLLCCIKKEVPK